jgi:Flp pilus assembly protein TadD
MKFTYPLIVGSILALAACTPQQNGTPPQAQGPNTLNVADAALLQSNPNDVNALIHEGDSYYALQRCTDSMAAYTLALNQDPKSSAAETGLGRCLLKTDAKSAEAAVSLAVQDDPGNAAALNDLGIARDLQGNFAGAIAPYQQALLAAPGDIATEVNLGLSLALSGNGGEALQYLGPLAAGQEATAKIRENYAAALIASGRDAEARQVLSIDLPPGKVDAAMAGFMSVMSNAQPPLAVGQNSVQPPTHSAAPTMSVSATPLIPEEAPAQPAPTLRQSRLTPVAQPAHFVAPAPRQANDAASKAQGGPKSTAALLQPVHASAFRRKLQVQLAALNSEADAQQKWARMAHQSPYLLGGLQPVIQNVDINGHAFYRLRIGSFVNRADAGRFCDRIIATRCQCVVALF